MRASIAAFCRFLPLFTAYCHIPGMSQGVTIHGFLYDLYTADIPQVYGRYTAATKDAAF
ncbi:MAG: hypothetical protein ABI760_24820 [Ferruginibacter sp.]